MNLAVRLYQLQYGFWALAVMLQIAVGVYMMKQRLHRAFPVFFCYTVFQVFRSTALFAILVFLKHALAGYRAYFVFYWVTDALSAGLCLVLIYEIAGQFFRDYPVLRKIISVCLVFGAIGLLLCDILIVRRAPGHENHQLIAIILLMERSLAIIQSGLVVILFACTQLMALPWRTNLSFGISLGLGLLGTVDIIADSVRAQYGTTINELFSFAKMFAYVLAALIWLVYILPPTKKSGIAVDVKSASADTCKWNEALKELNE